jgi:hypothetical protein
MHSPAHVKRQGWKGVHPCEQLAFPGLSVQKEGIVQPNVA